MGSIITFVADALVAILLIATIATCMALAKRITRLKADEATMRKTIGDLVLATENAQRAIAGLRTTLSDCDRTLGERLRTAERYAADLASQVEAGEGVLQRISQIVDATRLVGAGMSPSVAAEPAAPAAASAPATSGAEARLSKTAAIAQGLLERAVKRLEGAPA